MPDASTLIAATRAFGTDLLRETAGGAPDANVVLSPTSLAAALLLAYNGAAGETAAAIAATMRLPPGVSLDELNSAALHLQGRLAELDPQAAEDARYGAALTIPDDYRLWYQEACGLWLARGVLFREAYLRRARAFGPVGVAREAGQINSWVGEQTHGRITRIVERVEPLNSYLISAAYFKAGWAKPFEAQETAPAPFHLPGGAELTVPMMAMDEELSYAEDERCQYVALPLGPARGHFGEAYMLIALPRPGVGLGALLADTGWWDRSVRSRGHLVQLRLPRFRISYEANLTGALRALGMGVACSASADFGGLSALPTRLHELRHSTFLSVDEQGVEAAAATSIAVYHFGALPQPVEMTVDRPFLCAIVAARSGAPLFMGVVTNPEPLR